MNTIVDFFRTYPEMAIFLTIGLGFWIGNLRFKSFSLGTVTAVLLVGIVIGQMDIAIPGPMKSVFFLLFLFAIGYSVGPQFFQSLRSSGIKQVIFAVVVCFLCLGVTLTTAKLLGYNAGMAAGLFSGSQTISAVIGVGTDTIQSLDASAADKSHWIDMIPVCYAVTYIFGTIGSAYILGNIAPAMLGGMKKVKTMTKELEKTMNSSSTTDDPAFRNANEPVVFRAYKAESDFFDKPKTVTETEESLRADNHRLFVERIRNSAGIISNITPTTIINKGDEIVLSGRHEAVIGEERHLGNEIYDAELLSFPVENLCITLTKKGASAKTVNELRQRQFMKGIAIRNIKRGNIEVPVLGQTELYAGDVLEIVGLQFEVEAAAKELGYADRPTNKTDLVFVGLGILIGGIVGALTIHTGGVPISLSTSGGALIAGLVFGWLRTKHPTFGRIPQPAVWLLNNLGLNMFIAVIGIVAGPTFIEGIKEAGFTLFAAGIITTTLPLLIAVWLGNKVFKFHPAINLGCCAGARTTTAALGAIQNSLDSTVPALGYTVTYAIGNTLLILMGVAMVLLTA